MFGVGLAAAVAALTLVLAVTGQLALYINPDGAWFAVGMAVVALAGAVWSCTLPLREAHAAEDVQYSGRPAPAGRPSRGIPREPVASRAESPELRTGMPSHRHAHGDAGAHDHDHADAGGTRLAARLSLAGGGLATLVVAAGLLTPPATLSAELAMSRDTGAPPLFAGADVVALATTGDTSAFGIGEWASVFATTTNPDAFDGTEVTLTGFATPGDAGFQLTRLVITHCVIDAQPASVPIATEDAVDTGAWVTVTGTVRDEGGRLRIEASEIAHIDEPRDPYEF